MWLYSGEVVVIPVKVVVLRQKWLLRARWLYLGENGSTLAKVVVFGESG